MTAFSHQASDHGANLGRVHLVKSVVRRAGAWILLAMALVGCGTVSISQLSFRFPAANGIPELPVNLADYSGAVISIAAAPAGFQPVVDNGFSVVPAFPNAIVVHWIGGACDRHVAIDARDMGTLTFTVTTTRQARRCDAIGIPRALMIGLSRNFDASRISVDFGR